MSEEEDEVVRFVDLLEEVMLEYSQPVPGTFSLFGAFPRLLSVDCLSRLTWYGRDGS